MTYCYNFKKLAAWFVGLFFLAGLVFADSTQLATLKKLLESGQDNQAFEYAKKVYPDNVGNTDYDFMYSMAASRVGQYGRALFSLERMVATDPNNERLQLEIARLYFLQNNYEQSKIYFNQVLAKNPPKNVSDNIKRYLSDMEGKRAQSNRLNRYFLRFGIGDDTNINSASADNFINVPALGQVQLSDDAVQLHDQFFEYTAGMNGNKSFRKDQNLFWAADISRRVNPGNQEFNSDVLDLGVGYGWQLGQYSVTTPVRFQQRNLQTHPFLRNTAVGIEVGRLLGQDRKALVYFERSSTIYPTQRILDKGNYLTALSYIHLFPKLLMSVQPTLLYLSSNASDSDAKYNGSKLYGAMLKVNKQMLPRHSLELTGGYQNSWYDRNNPLFNIRRRDQIYNSTAKWKWQFKPDLSFDLSYGYYVDDSNLSLYHYKRKVTELGVEYWF